MLQCPGQLQSHFSCSHLWWSDPLHTICTLTNGKFTLPTQTSSLSSRLLSASWTPPLIYWAVHTGQMSRPIFLTFPHAVFPDSVSGSSASHSLRPKLLTLLSSHPMTSSLANTVGSPSKHVLEFWPPTLSSRSTFLSCLSKSLLKSRSDLITPWLKSPNGFLHLTRGKGPV
jgi:hypothetical protein